MSRFPWEARRNTCTVHGPLYRTRHSTGRSLRPSASAADSASCPPRIHRDPALESVPVPNPHDLKKLAEEIKPYFKGQVKLKTAEFGEEIID